MENIKIIDYESNEKIIKSLKIFKDDAYGLNSSIFYLKNDILLKLLNKPMDQYMIDILIFIRKLETKTIVNFEELIRIKNLFYGYTLKLKQGKNLLLLSQETILKNYFKTLINLEKDIEYLSKNNIIAHDLKDSNILYNNITNETNIIDTDYFYLDEISSYEMILMYNKSNLYTAIFDSLIKPIFDSNVNKELYKMLFDYFRSNDYKDSIDVFYTKYIELIENYTDNKITTLNDYKKMLTLKK